MQNIDIHDALVHESIRYSRSIVPQKEMQSPSPRNHNKLSHSNENLAKQNGAYGAENTSAWSRQSLKSTNLPKDATHVNDKSRRGHTRNHFLQQTRDTVFARTQMQGIPPSSKRELQKPYLYTIEATYFVKKLLAL